MNFSPFVGNFPFSVTSAATTQVNIVKFVNFHFEKKSQHKIFFFFSQENRFTNSNFQSTIAPTKFRAEDIVGSGSGSGTITSNIITSNKYTSQSSSNTLNYGAITYNVGSDNTKNTTNFPQISTTAGTTQQSQILQTSDLSQVNNNIILISWIKSNIF